MLGEANKKLEGAERKLTGIRAKVAELNAKVAALEANLMKATEDKNNAVAQVRACCSVRCRAGLLLDLVHAAKSCGLRRSLASAHAW